MRRALALLLGLVATAATAQVSARTGAITIDPTKQFASPMVLELPFPRLATMSDQTSARFAEIAEYWCDDARIIDFVIGNRRRGSKNSSVLSFSGAVEVMPSFARIASIIVTIRGGGVPGSTAIVKKIDAEEKKKTKFRGILKIPDATMKALATDPEGIRREITLTLKGSG